MRLKWAMLIVAVCAVGCAEERAQRTEDTAEVIRAERFEIVDSDGQVRASLSTSTDGSPWLHFYDAQGEARVLLWVHPVDGAPMFQLSAGQTPDASTYDSHISLSFVNGEPGINLGCLKSKGWVSLAVHEGQPFLALNRPNSRTAALEVLGEEGPRLQLGRRVWSSR